MAQVAILVRSLLDLDLPEEVDPAHISHTEWSKNSWDVKTSLHRL